MDGTWRVSGMIPTVQILRNVRVTAKSGTPEKTFSWYHLGDKLRAARGSPLGIPVRARRVRFGTFEADLDSGELRKHGLKIKLQDQPFQVLVLLLERSGDVVTREELRQKLWPAEAFVDFDVGLNAAIKRLRDALGDSAETPRFVETLPRRGYRFIAPTEEVPGGPVGRKAEGTPAPGSAEAAAWSHPIESVAAASNVGQPKIERGWTKITRVGYWFALGTAAVLLALFLGLNLRERRGRLLGRADARRIRSLAVLPLDNLSGDPSQEYFVDGMTDALITNLGKISALRVISRTSAMTYKNTKKPLRDIARELEVDAIVEGTVARSGDHIRITANLVQAFPERHLWAESYERELRDVFALQRVLASAIANEIQVKLTPQEQARIPSRKPIDPEAYQAYLKGRYFWNRRTGRDLQMAVKYFQRAIELEPSYALAYAGLADTYCLLSDYGALPSKEAFPMAKAAALQALQIDDTLAEAYPSLGWVRLFYDWDFRGADRDLMRAVELNPNYATAHHWYGWYLLQMGRFDQGTAELNAAHQLDPFSLAISSNLGTALYFEHRYDEAIEQYRKTLEMDPNFVKTLGHLGDAYEQKGMHAEAVAEWLKMRIISGESPQRIARLTEAFRLSGVSDYWQEELNLTKQDLRHGFVDPVAVASTYVHLGDKSAALGWLERGFKERDGSLVYLKASPEFDPLRADPRFRDLLRRIGLQP
jgi:TolB-like protein/DNA-binding winged helix-turn-helix (wHTH) protein